LLHASVDQTKALLADADLRDRFFLSNALRMLNLVKSIA
jgi:hypothetical protein